MKQHMLTLLLLLYGSQQIATAAPQAAINQLPPTIDIADIEKQAPIYNESNGYWADSHSVNAEMLRDQLKISVKQWNTLKVYNESNGYW